MELIKKLWQGEYGLAKTFWLYWFVPTIILGWFATSTIFRLLVIKTIGVSVALSTVLAFGVPIGITVFHVFMSIASWNTSRKYIGNKVWPVLTKVYVILFVTFLAYTWYSAFTLNTDDPGKDNNNISESLDRDPAYPFVGLWKGSCKDRFGLAINKVDDRFYSISFCGPGGCFKPGTYRPNSKLLDDPKYKIVDADTIKVKGADGFSIYHRCE